MKVLSQKVDAFLKFIIALCLSLMAIFVFGNVVMRYVFNSGITWSEEVSRFLFIWLIFLGAILALKDNEHLGVDSLVKKLPVTGKKIVYIISNVFILITLVLVFNGSWKLTLLNVDQSSPAIGMPYAYIYVFGCIMSVSMAIIILVNLYRVIFKKIDVSQLIMTTDSEELVEQMELENGGTDKGGMKK
ncbi:TRAP transporter small permease [Domibacillus aminovorans]|uniref:C4-dicarboxylate ABC transporter permease n=1 Tax=Domibacillus aminovorans TaxID=29332 RepID=A0A177L2K5_9BACI|nr:TRAP transporter small permease [Domibacillus aminovorans]OAH59001.1 C4-dicarboxylate ABC transporter permease [Domibacillus aminovorans]